MGDGVGLEQGRQCLKKVNYLNVAIVNGIRLESLVMVLISYYLLLPLLNLYFYILFFLIGTGFLQWGFRRCEDICWVKTNKSTATPGLRHDSHTLFQHSKVG